MIQEILIEDHKKIQIKRHPVYKLYNIYQDHIRLFGQMERDDAEFWQLVDLEMTKADWLMMLQFAKKSPNWNRSRHTVEPWLLTKLAQDDFKIRPKKARRKTSNDNRFLWSLMMCGFEGIKRSI